MSVGVVVGRFQTFSLTVAHQALLNEVKEKSDRMCVFIGISPNVHSKEDPLPFESRAQMISELLGSEVQVLPIFDSPSNDEWSATLDTTIKNLYPFEEPTLYYGRASGLAKGYTGSLKLEKVFQNGLNIACSATEMRKEAATYVDNDTAWRRGVIYATQNQYPRINLCVDVAVVRKNGDDIRLLVGCRKSEDGKLRLPGGHVDPSDETTVAAAKRELQEETGLEAGEPNSLGVHRVKTWKDTPGQQTFSHLFVMEYTMGHAIGADDLDDTMWIDLNEYQTYTWADDHKKLVGLVHDFCSGVK